MEEPSLSESNVNIYTISELIPIHEEKKADEEEGRRQQARMERNESDVNDIIVEDRTSIIVRGHTDDSLMG